VALSEIEQHEKLLDALGVAPKEQDPPETPEIAQQRAGYEEDIAFYRARVARAEVSLARADALSATISDLSREQLLIDLVEVNSFPLAPQTISLALPSLYRVARALVRTPVDWWDGLLAEKRTPTIFLRMAGFLAFAFLAGWAVCFLTVKYLGRDLRAAEPTYARRLLGTIAEGVSRGIFPALILTVILLRITSGESVITGPFAEVLATLCVALILFVLAWALPRAALAPDFPNWRLTVLTPEGAQSLSHRIAILAAIVALSLFIEGAMSALPVGQQLSKEAGALHRFFFAVIIAAGLLAILQPRLWRIDPEAARKRSEEDETSTPPGRGSFWVAVHALFAVLAISAVIAGLFGYGQLGAYLIESLILTGLIGGGFYLARGLLRESIAVVLRTDLVTRKLAVQHRTRRRVKFWLRALLDIVIAIGTVF